MKVKYKGPLAECVVPGVGRFKRGEIRSFPADLALRLIASGSFIQIVAPPKKVTKRPPKEIPKEVPKKASKKVSKKVPKKVAKKESKEESDEESPAWGTKDKEE